VSQLQAQAASANASLQSATQSLNNASSSIQSSINSATTNLQNCLSQNSIFGVPNPIPCTSQVISIGSSIAGSFTTTMQGYVQSVTQLVNQVAGIPSTSAAQNVAPLVNTTIQSLQQTGQNAASQISNISNQTSTCLTQVASAAAANATATANATTAG